MRATRGERRRQAGWVEPWLLAAFIVLALVPVGCDVFDQVALYDQPWAYWCAYALPPSPQSIAAQCAPNRRAWPPSPQILTTDTG